MTDSPSFNVLVDPWVPLDRGGGSTELVSYRDLIAGKCDAADLRHPREDCEYFARMLLSALTQVLFGHLVETKEDLRRMLHEPLDASVVDTRIAEVRDDFELLGDAPFLQVPAAKDIGGRSGARKLVLDAGNHELFKLGTVGSAFEPATALLLLYGALAFAGAGGSGYKASSRGMSPATCLLSIVPSQGARSVRRDVWANVLTRQHLAALGEDGASERPWRPHREPRDLDDGTLLESLFWQPRAVAFSPASAGTCAVTGKAVAWRLEIVGYGAWSGPAEKRFVAHPWSPTRRPESADELPTFARLATSRPIWSQLATFFPAVRGGTGDRAEIYDPAPVLTAFRDLDLDDAAILLVFAYVYDRATTEGRFYEPFPLDASVWERDMQRVAASGAVQAEKILAVIQRRVAQPSAKSSAGMAKREESACAFPARKGGKLLRDVDRSREIRSGFWARAEAPFWEMFEAAKRDEDGAPAYQHALRRLALALFDEVTKEAADNPRLASQVARARRALGRDLGGARLSTARPEGLRSSEEGSGASTA